MTLVDTRGYNLDPNITGNIATGLQFGQAIGKQDRAAEIRGLLAQQGQTAPQTPEQVATGKAPAILSQEELIRQAKAVDPVQAEEILTSMGLDDASKRAEFSRFAAKIQSLPFEQRGEAINARARELQEQGRDPSETLQLLGVSEETQNRALTGIQLMDLSTKERFDIQAKQAAVTAKATTAKKVQSSSILPNGTTIQILSDGKTQVTDPAGNVLSGKARGDAIKEAQRYGVTIQQLRAQGRETGKMTAEKVENLTDQTDKLRSNNRNLREVIAEVKSGAKTGVIQQYLPSIRASSRRLDNLKNRLGLDVVSSVTFGALSEKELEMAKETALPTGLDEPELAKWAEDRINAQEKLIDYMEQQAVFLSKPGNTVVDWIEMAREKKKQREADEKAAAADEAPEANQKGWPLMVDAQGNKAYVGPNGEIEEVK